jgi:poly(A) polymerase/tRNA nucleotidyltransferase (CCA-adding enzyme)
MKFPKNIINSVENAIKYHRFFRNYADGTVPPDKKIRKFINECGDNIGNVVDLMNANNLYQTYDKKKRQALDILNRIEELDELEEAKNVKLPIDGKDIMKEFNLKAGPQIGIIMEHLKEAYFENPKITKEECFKLVEDKIKVLAV